MPSYPISNNILLWEYKEPCIQGVFIKRSKRFSVLCLVDGEEVWAHTNNSGSMLGLLRKNNPILLSKASNEKRKLKYTLEAIALQNCPKNMYIGVNTLMPNRLLKLAWGARALDFLSGYEDCKLESVFGKSRIDALFTSKNKKDLWVECKNVTLVEDEVAAFPDAVTERGKKHLETLIDIKKRGDRAAMFYCIQRIDSKCFYPAGYVDIDYEEAFKEAIRAGVEIYAYEFLVDTKGIYLTRPIPLNKSSIRAN